MRVIYLIEYFHGPQFAERRTKVYQSAAEFNDYIEHFQTLMKEVNNDGLAISKFTAFKLEYTDSGGALATIMCQQTRIYKPIRELNAPEPVLTSAFI